MYEGKEPCPGCGRTGEEVSRKGKNELCYDCQKALEIGRALIKEKNLERNHYRLDELKIGTLTWYTIRIREIDNALGELLMTFSEFDKNFAADSRLDTLAGRLEATTARDTYVLPVKTFEAARKLCNAIKDVAQQMEDDRRGLEDKMKEQLKHEKNDIYNAGVAHGRDLLRQLNNGEITPKDLEKYINRY